ncbi:MAG: hypothetical protein K8U57_39645, partial [Planctomycetes bacterium]|nr:hypothetical protein [Planctomycetota bacterium]
METDSIEIPRDGVRWSGHSLDVKFLLAALDAHPDELVIDERLCGCVKAEVIPLDQGDGWMIQWSVQGRDIGETSVVGSKSCTEFGMPAMLKRSSVLAYEVPVYAWTQTRGVDSLHHRHP